MVYFMTLMVIVIHNVHHQTLHLLVIAIQHMLQIWEI